MGKVKKAWFCSNCGAESAKWLGRCPSCGEWNTFAEEIIQAPSAAGGRSSGTRVSTGARAVPIGEISTQDQERISLHNDELDRLLGGGLVPGSVILIGGEPGIGKSTLSLQIPLHAPHLLTLYVSGEESARQIRMRAQRLAPAAAAPAVDAPVGSPAVDASVGSPAVDASVGSPAVAAPVGSSAVAAAASPSVAADSSAGPAASLAGSSPVNPVSTASVTPAAGPDNCLVLCETMLENILERAREINPALLIIDSIQTVYSQLLDSSPGSVTQVRECAAMLLRYAKETHTPVILVGHITKEGSIAGPKVLEHIVDVVLQFEGDNTHTYRMLRSFKNRYGSTAELAIFEMTQTGLREVKNPSEMLIPMHEENLSGMAVAAMVDGTRPFLIETQALVSTAAYGTPQRSATGFDIRRMNMLLAVLEKRAGFRLATKDVFLNMAGGLKVTDPATDLAVVSAILSSAFDLAIPGRWCFSAEVGLSGEIRPVPHLERRIAEANRLGFEKIFISSYNARTHIPKGTRIEIEKVSGMGALGKLLFKS
ncbi:MAG: DNA repair protein RadA [Bacteroidales bacterium]|jgi:DNA repair protein RadA/Sms|nr:DNA repair protein RadA [Bacteroidales bacterium]